MWTRARAIHHELLKQRSRAPWPKALGQGLCPPLDVKSLRPVGQLERKRTWEAQEAPLLPSPSPLAIARTQLPVVGVMNQAWGTQVRGQPGSPLGRRQRLEDLWVQKCGSSGPGGADSAGFPGAAVGACCSYNAPSCEARVGGQVGLRCPWSPSVIMTRPANGGGSDLTWRSGPSRNHVACPAQAKEREPVS